jgi:hypothetical protein
MIKRGMSFAELLVAVEERRASRTAAMRWIGCRRYAQFLALLQFNRRLSPRGRLPLRPLHEQLAQNRFKPGQWRAAGTNQWRRN